MNRKENVSAVYRLDNIATDPTAIQNAINRVKQARKSDLTDVSKPLKQYENNKKDALSNIDINNFEIVPLDASGDFNLEELLGNTEGFQVVMSKKAKRDKQKAIQDELIRQNLLALKKKEKEAASKAGKVSKAKRNALAADAKRMSKLPPRFAKQREQKEREKKEVKTSGGSQAGESVEQFTIESWDNELAEQYAPPAPAARRPGSAAARWAC